jgi:ATP-binding cassette subfamily F protein 3
MIRLIQIDKQFVTKKLFESADLHIKPGERVGIVGPNGSGKTTLLKIIRGLEPVDNGEVVIAKNKTTGYLEQDVTETPAETVLEEVMRGFPEIAQAEHKLIELEQQLEARPDDETLLKKYGRLREAFEHLDGYRFESNARAILTGIGFAPAQHKMPVRSFSGGWMMRIALARLLMQKPDILLMDEPTNHLDLDSMIWLEGFLQNYEGTVLLISHDRFFLNRVINRVVEISGKKLVSYAGNYDAFRQEKAARLELAEAAYKNQQRKLAQTERFIERFRYKATKARQVQSRVKQLEKSERIELPENDTPQLRFRFPQPERSGAIVAELIDVEKRYGEKPVYRNLNYAIQRQQKIALVGHNGAGKSTLLKILADATDIQAGERKIGHNVTPYYYAQHQLDILDAQNTILEELAEAVPDQPEQWLRRLAGMFLFPGDDVFKKISVLSGGEKARVALAKMLARPANFLILDEPTNHLDIQARAILEQAMADYSGTMIFISHDRKFINAIASSVVEIQNGNLRAFAGDYDYYLWKKQQDSAGSVEKSESAASQSTTTPNAGEPVSKKEDRRLRAQQRQNRQQRIKPLHDALAKNEAKIAALETQKATLTKELCKPEIIADKKAFPEKSKQLSRINDALEKEYEAWSDLTEKLEEEMANL